MGASVIILFGLLSVTFAALIPTEETYSPPCDRISSEGCPTAPDCSICGCDNSLIFDEQKGYCVLNTAYLSQLSAVTNYVSEDNDMTVEDSIARYDTRLAAAQTLQQRAKLLRTQQAKLRERVDKVFQGIILSAIFFIVCASVCAISVCIFCCHIHHSDGKLKKEVNALAKKMHIKVNKDSAPLVKNQGDPKAQSCNVTVTDADIMCV